MDIKQPKTFLQWMKLYRLYQEAFPASEKKPFSMIRKMYAKGKSDVWYCEEAGKFAGLVITINGPETILLDYLAVVKNRRSQGIGSELLHTMKKKYVGKNVFLEIELVDETAENYLERKRRKQFYLANGMTEMQVYAELFGVNMELLGFGRHLTFEEYHEFYRENYSEWAAAHVKPMKKHSEQ